MLGRYWRSRGLTRRRARDEADGAERVGGRGGGEEEEETTHVTQKAPDVTTITMSHRCHLGRLSGLQREVVSGRALRRDGGRGEGGDARHGVVRACKAHDRHTILHRDAVLVPLWLCCVAARARFRRLISALALRAILLLDIAQCGARLALTLSSGRVVARLSRVGVHREGAVVGRHRVEGRRASRGAASRRVRSAGGALVLQMLCERRKPWYSRLVE